jgi:hypothetical protein
MLYSQNAPTPDDVAACYFEGHLAHLGRLSERILCFGKTVQTGVGDPFNRKNFDR